MIYDLEEKRHLTNFLFEKAKQDQRQGRCKRAVRFGMSLNSRDGCKVKKLSDFSLLLLMEKYLFKRYS